MDMAGCLQKTRPSQASALVGCLLVLCSLSFSTVGAQDFDPAFLFGPRPGPNSESILVANSGVRVPFGRSIFIDPIKDLVTEVQPGDRCYITVLENDPLAQRPGMLSPKKFPCAFGAEEVKYTHFGSRSPNKDRVRLQLRYDSQTDTIIIPFMLEVEVVSQQLEVLTRNMPLVVDKLNGISNPIDKKVLEFTYDGSSESCKVTTLISTGGLPRYGTLLNYTSNGQMMVCDDFVNLGIRYKHTSTNNSPNRDYIPMLVELLDKEGNPVKQEYFQIMVRIKEGTENTPPKPSFVAMMMMEIDQFVMTAITNDMLAAEDVESDQDYLNFNITSPLGYEQGYIISTDDQNLPISSFYQRDINDLKIAYKPPSADSDVERIFQIEFEVVDTEGAISDSFAFMIVVKPMNTLAPVATRNTGQMLFEGQSRALSSTQNLEISDEDNLEDVRITVIDGLKHGELTVLGARRKFFTPADLDAGVVVYQHDGSDTYSDNIIFRMTDGRHEVEFLFPITIAPTDDEPPIINANTGLVLFKNEIMQISPFILSATDIDSEDSSIKFIVEPPYSTTGELLLRQAEQPSDLSAWQFSESEEMFEQVVRKWFQQDILDGKLFYRHIGPHSTTTVMDQFVFRVQDDNDPPNQSGEHIFTIKIHPVDDLPPELFPGTSLHMTVKEYFYISIGSIDMVFPDVINKGVTLKEGGRVTLTTDLLSTTDINSPDEHLSFSITRAPSRGHLECTDFPGVPITSFTQLQLAGNKIYYIHTSYDEIKMDSFEFEVTDGYNPVFRTFRISITDVDNKKPVLTIHDLVVAEGEVKLITPFELTVEDRDTPDDILRFTITQVPVHGQLLYNGSYVVTSFTKQDLNENLISYKHDGTESSEDSFSFTVTDGTHTEFYVFPDTFFETRKPQMMTIRVISIDNGIPQIVVNKGAPTIRLLHSGHLGFMITSKALKSEDRDSHHKFLKYRISEDPLHGYIVNTALGNDSVKTFSQADIDEMKICYVLRDGDNATSDIFYFTIEDNANTMEEDFAAQHQWSCLQEYRSVFFECTTSPDFNN
ncbi:UNVERIFIED_CONTAM: hypothetical protein FKN15_051793 [Acipenser sinensis]